MGSSTSKKQQEEYKRREILLEQNARKKYNERIKAYTYLYHGDYFIYVQNCQAQYELECIPPSCRYGNHYDPNMHDGFV